MLSGPVNLLMELQHTSAINPPWLHMQPLRLGDAPLGTPTPDEYILVSREGAPWARIDHYRSSNEYYFKAESVAWHSWLVLGLGEQVYFINSATRALRSHRLGSYFVGFWVDQAGSIVWASECVGIDGVVINSVEGGMVYGEGEWDPPGGWERFSLDLASGAAR